MMEIVRGSGAWRRRMVLLGGILFFHPACTAASHGGGGVEAPRQADLSPELASATFNAAWSGVHQTYYDTTFGGLDWKAVRQELQPRASAATTNEELRGVLQEMLGRLGDSHFGIIPAELGAALDPDQSGNLAGEVGLEIRWIDEALLVSRVVPDGPAAHAGVRPGWSVMSIRGQDVAAWVARTGSPDISGRLPALEIQMVGRATGMLRGEEGSRVEVEFLDHRDRRVLLELQRVRPTGEPIRIGNLPTMFGQVETNLRHLPEGCVGELRFNVWMAPLAEPLLKALDEFADCRGIVLDLRGNLGGLMAMVPALSGAILQERTLIGTLLTRDRATRFYSSPRQATHDGTPTRPFSGAVAVVVDGLTLSAAEVFTAGLQGNGRARVFGSPTAGEALPSRTTRLPNGDVMLHAYADFTGPDGSRLEGIGVLPDEHVAHSRADLLAGRDRPLEAAVTWITSGQPEARGGS